MWIDGDLKQQAHLSYGWSIEVYKGMAGEGIRKRQTGPDQSNGS